MSIDFNYQYSFSNVVSGRHYDGNEGWVDTPVEERAEMLWKFKQWLLTHVRKSGRPYVAICNMTIDHLPNNYGIFERLIINKKGNVQYVSGQDYDAEMKTIKQLIIKHCY